MKRLVVAALLAAAQGVHGADFGSPPASLLYVRMPLDAGFKAAPLEFGLRLTGSAAPQSNAADFVSAPRPAIDLRFGSGGAKLNGVVLRQAGRGSGGL